MNKLMAVLMSALFLLCVPLAQAADEEEDHSAHHPEAGDAQAQPPKAGDKDKHAMHEHMKEMRETMEQARTATDPAERRQALQAHAEAMRKGMKAMRGMGKDTRGCGKMGGMKEEKPAGEEGEGMGGMKGGMMKCHKMMERRMDAMQKMMEQMIEHEGMEREIEKP